jgi:transposase
VKLHVVTGARGCPLKFFMTAGQVSDHTGALALLGSLPAAEWMIADRGYDADWFREALKDKGIRPCIPGR